MSTPVKVFKKGDVIFKEGDKISSMMLIQIGSVAVCLQRQKRNIDIFQLGPSHVLGEQALLGANTHTFTAIATTETKVVEVPVDIFKQNLEAGAQLVKALVKSLNDRLKITLNEVRTFRLDKDASPCPEDQVAKVYGCIYHIANHKGAKDAKEPNKRTMDWGPMKQYAQRVFAEPIKRMENAINILVKFKLAQYEMGRPPEDPEGPEQIMKVHFLDITAIENFFEFYQYYFFKTGKSEVLKVEDQPSLLLNHFIELCNGVQPDRFNVVTLDYAKVLERFKTDLNITLNQDHFARLEQKGLFMKRQTRQDNSIVLQFDVREFKSTQLNWRFIKEIEKWNEKGSVDPNEKEVVVKKKPDAQLCPQCSTEFVPNAKFCSQCGYKLAA